MHINLSRKSQAYCFRTGRISLYPRSISTSSSSLYIVNYDGTTLTVLNCIYLFWITYNFLLIGDNLIANTYNNDLNLSRTFEAQMSPEIVYSIAGVLSILAVTVYIWWTLVIPQQRSKLAISKKKGDVKQFLDSIDDDSNNGSH